MTTAPAPEAAKAAVRVELTLRLPGGVGPLCEFVRDCWLPAMYPGETGRRVALHTYDGKKFVKVTNISTKAGAIAFNAAVAHVDNEPRGGEQLSLISWVTGQPFGYGPVGGDEIWVTMARDVDAGEGEYRVYMICPAEKAQLLIELTVKTCSTFEVLSGGSWSPGGRWPSWADHRWQVLPLPPPMIVGPMWLVVAPAAANQLLAGSDQALQMAVDRHPLPDGGAVWQLCAEPDGPTGAELDTWSKVLTDLSIWAEPSIEGAR